MFLQQRGLGRELFRQDRVSELLVPPADADLGGLFLFFKLWDRSGDLDVMSPLQPLLTVDQVVNPIHQNLHQLHLKM